MKKQEQSTLIIEQIKQSNHPFTSWILNTSMCFNNIIDFKWLLLQQQTLKELSSLDASSLEFNGFTKKDILKAIKGHWDVVKRLYFKDYFLEEILTTESHPLFPLLQDLSKGINSHDVYLVLESRWEQQIGTYCLSLGEDFSNLSKLALSKFYTAKKNDYYDHVLSIEIKTSLQNPFHSFVSLVDTHDLLDESLYQEFEHKVSEIERLIFNQNEQYQRKLITTLKPYFIKGKQAYYKTKGSLTSWEMTEADVRRHTTWLSSNHLLDQISRNTCLVDEFKDLMDEFNHSQLTREREMGYFDFCWTQKEFEKRLRFLEKRLTISTDNQFASWLKQMRMSQGLSYRQLEHLSGVSATYLHRLELGARKSPSIPIAKKITQAFGVSLEVVTKFLDSHDELEPASGEQELDLLKVLEFKPFTIGETHLSKKKRQHLGQLLDLIVNKSFNPNHLPDTIELIELVKLIRKN